MVIKEIYSKDRERERIKEDLGGITNINNQTTTGYPKYTKEVTKR